MHCTTYNVFISVQTVIEKRKKQLQIEDKREPMQNIVYLSHPVFFPVDVHLVFVFLQLAF